MSISMFISKVSNVIAHMALMHKCVCCAIKKKKLVLNHKPCIILERLIVVILQVWDNIELIF